MCSYLTRVYSNVLVYRSYVTQMYSCVVLVTIVLGVVEVVEGGCWILVVVLGEFSWLLVVVCFSHHIDW